MRVTFLPVALYLIVAIWGPFGAYTLAGDGSPQPPAPLLPFPLSMGMSEAKTLAALPKGSQVFIDNLFLPSGAARMVKNAIIGLDVELQLDRVNGIVFSPPFGLSVSMAPFKTAHYNIPADVQRMLSWGMSLADFKTALDVWSQSLAGMGVTVVRRSDEYVESDSSTELRETECIMEACHPSRHQYWVVFGPKDDRTWLPRIQWSFSFLGPNDGLGEISVLDRVEQAGLLLNTSSVGNRLQEVPQVSISKVAPPVASQAAPVSAVETSVQAGDLTPSHCRRGEFTIGLPPGWVTEEEDSGQGLWVFVASSPEESPTDPFLENINVIVVAADTSSLQDANAKAISLFKQHVAQFQLLDQGLSRMGSNEAAWFTYTADHQGSTVKVLKVTILSGEAMFMVTCTAYPETFDRYQPVFERIVSSITFDRPAGGAAAAQPGGSAVGIAGKLGSLVGAVLGLYLFVRLLARK